MRASSPEVRGAGSSSDFSGIGTGISGAFKTGLALGVGMVKSTLVTMLNAFDLFLNLLSGHWGAAWQNILNIGSANWNDWVKPLWTGFFRDVISPIQHWFTVDIVDYFAGMGQQWLQNVMHMWDVISNDLIKPAGNFFTKTIPGWFTDVTNWWGNTTLSMWNHFYSAVVTPFLNFWTKQIPGWFTDVMNWWGNTTLSIWNHFYSGCCHPGYPLLYRDVCWLVHPRHPQPGV